jgi:hypothetical protein
MRLRLWIKHAEERAEEEGKYQILNSPSRSREQHFSCKGLHVART